MPSSKKFGELLAATVYDNADTKIGRVREVFVDDNTKEPVFVEAFRNALRTRAVFIPLAGHSLDGKKLTVAFPLSLIDGAPKPKVRNTLTVDHQNDLYTHYQVPAAEPPAGPIDPADTAETADTDGSEAA